MDLSMGHYMNNWKSTMRPIILTLILTAGRGLAGTPEINQNPAPPPGDLTLSNFFTAGWDQPYSFRSSLPDGAPDLPLFTLVTNFLARVSRTDYFYQGDLGKSPIKDVQFLDEYIDYAFNQRFMLSVFGNYTGIDHRDGPYQAGGAAGAQLRFQLVDTPTDSDALNFRVDSPDQGLGDHTTKLSSSITGWRDLSPLGAGRLGLYYDVIDEAYAGSAPGGMTRNDLAYGTALAKTWTKPTDPVANLSTFVEVSAATTLNGTERNRTQVNATPGVQFVIGGRNVLMFGVDFPLTHPSDTRNVYRVTYIYCY
jgi:hypothetical protein